MAESETEAREPVKVSGRELTAAFLEWEQGHPNQKLPYGTTEGYWNTFLTALWKCGFKVVSCGEFKPTEAKE
jgi:hypothetical protein